MEAYNTPTLIFVLQHIFVEKHDNIMIITYYIYIIPMIN